MNGLAAPRRTRMFDTLMLIIGLIVVWQLLYLIAGRAALTSPWETVRYTVGLLHSDSFAPHVVATATAFAYSVVIASLLGVGIGSVLGLHRLSGDVAEPILTALYSVPKVTLYPLILLIFGLGISAKVAFGVIHGVIPVVIFTMNAMKNVAPIYLKTGRVLRLPPNQVVLHILIPATLPEIVTGLRVGFSLTLLGVLIGEMFASQRGLGFLIMNAINVNDVRTITAVILLLFLFATVANALMLAVEHRLYRHAE